jgi:apolipoprotein N-acyltransferase
MTHQRTRKDLALSILAGFLFGTSYIPFPAWAIFFCYVPLWMVWMRAEPNNQSTKHVFFTGWVMQFVLLLIGFNWVAHTVSVFGHMPLWAGCLVLMLFCSTASLNIPIAGAVWHWLFKNAPVGAKIVGLVTLTAITERLYPMIFDFHLGYTWLWMKFPAFQTASVFGFFGLSTITIAINGLVLWGFLMRKRRIHAGVAIVGILVALFAWGTIIESNLPKPDRSARVLVVQVNIGDEAPLWSLYGQAARPMIFEKFVKVTSEALAASPQPIDFAVWPETAFPDALPDPNLSFGFPNRLKLFLQQKNLALITGAYGFVNGKMSNSLFSLDKTGKFSSLPYAKTHLLAFGEYLPGSTWFPKLKTWIPEVADWARGGGPQILKLENFRLGAQICYEGLFDSFSRGLAQKGAQMIVNATHDNWYGTWEEPYQHAYMTFARAVETRLPLIRGTNTGISGVALASGEILEKSPMNEVWSKIYDVPYLENPVPTAFLSWGFYIFPVILALSFVGLLIGRFLNWRLS